MKDTRTPFLADGIKVIQHAGFTPVIRNAGGLGIISDQGILNISLIFPQRGMRIGSRSMKATKRCSL